jgi:hypothetical protein
MKRKKLIFFLAVPLILIIIFFVVAQIYANKNQMYANTKYGYSFIFSKQWTPAIEISKVFSVQKYTAYLATKMTSCSFYDDSEDMLDNDYTAEELNIKTEKFQNCIKNSPNFSAFEEALKNYQLNWSFYQSDIAYFSDLSSEEINNLVKKGSTLSKLDLPNGHFISVYLWDDLTKVEEAKYTEKDGKILETRLIDMTYAGLDDVTLIDARRLSQVDDGLIHSMDLNIPYTPKVSDEYTQQFKSIVLSTNIPYGDEREGVFYQIIKYFKFE